MLLWRELDKNLPSLSDEVLECCHGGLHTGQIAGAGTMLTE